ncbi:RHS repeat-associated core domain-containing protein [Sanyastnella coralliicola]|uniref:RHS repeat-associated core domain-containing protein n=1 Tax=Sanyastnella coralliicola TaxID=3069118 RepID=UPI0027BB0570|nr:RHS repeat-associated core domain-containing protein [Longitalea sp. SCSIO 12813]
MRTTLKNLKIGRVLLLLIACGLSLVSIGQSMEVISPESTGFEDIKEGEGNSYTISIENCTLCVGLRWYVSVNSGTSLLIEGTEILTETVGVELDGDNLVLNTQCGAEGTFISISTDCVGGNPLCLHSVSFVIGDDGIDEVMPILDNLLNEEKVCVDTDFSWQLTSESASATSDAAEYHWTIDSYGQDCDGSYSILDQDITVSTGPELNYQFDSSDPYAVGYHRVTVEAYYTGCDANPYGDSGDIIVMADPGQYSVFEANPLSDLSGINCSSTGMVEVEVATKAETDPCFDYFWANPWLENVQYTLNYNGGSGVTFLNENFTEINSAILPTLGENPEFILAIDDYATSGMVEVTAINSCGTETTAINLSLANPPSPTGPIQGPSSICDSPTDSYSYMVDPVNNASSYTWNIEGGNNAWISSGQGTNQISVNWPDQGTYSLQVTPANSSGCGEGTTQDISIYVHPNDLVEVSQFTIGDGNLASFNSQALFINGCEGQVCVDKQIDHAYVNIRLDMGDIYEYGMNEFGYGLDLQVDFFADAGMTQLLDSKTTDMLINQHEPEEVFRYPFTEIHPETHAILITVSNYSAVNSVGTDAVRLICSYEEEFKYGVSNVSFGGPLVQNTGFYIDTETGKAVMQWSPVGCVEEFPGYQVQLLKLYHEFNGAPGGAMPDNSTLIETQVSGFVDWSQALQVEVEDGATQISLSLMEGTGFYIWRVRPIGNLYSDGLADERNYGVWSTTPEDLSPVAYDNTDGTYDIGTGPVVGYYQQFDEDRNWVYSRSFAENVKIAEQLSFANGLLQSTQNQALSQSNRKVVAQQSVMDYMGRPAVTSMAIPTGQKTLGYIDHFMTESDGVLFTAKHFDRDHQNPNPVDISGNPYFDYYSDLNPDPRIPSSEGYPYTRVRFSNDGTDRAIEQAGLGETFRMRDATSPNSRTTIVHTTAVADDELIRVFGDEAPDAETVVKTITIDPNKVANVTYTSKSGQTIATCLARTGAEGALEHLDSANDDPLIVTQDIESDMMMGPNTIFSSHEVTLVEEPSTVVSIDYSITANDIYALCANYCSSCDYIIEIWVESNSCPELASLGLVATHAIPSSELNCGDPGWTPETWSYVNSWDLPPGTYTFTRKVHVNNVNTDGETPISWLDHHLNLLEEQYQANADAGLSVLQTLLEVGDYDAVLSYLQANGTYDSDGDGYNDVNWNLDDANTYPESVDLEIIPGCYVVSIPVSTCDENYCPSLDAGETLGDYFYNHFVNYWDGQSFVYGDAFLGEYSQAEFVNLINNMVDHPYESTFSTFYQGVDPLESPENVSPVWDQNYQCSEMWMCWMMLTQTYQDTYNALDGSDSSLDYDVVDAFVECQGKRIEGYTLIASKARENAYRWIYYNPAASTACEELIFGCVSPSCLIGDDEASPNLFSGNFASRLAWQDFAACVEGQAPYNGYLSATEPVEDLISVCEDVCETRRDAFETGIIQMIHAQGLYIQDFDENYLVQDYTYGLEYISGSTPIAPVDLANPDFFSYTWSEVQCMVNAMVEHCKGDCQLTPQYDGLGEFLTAGTTEEMNLYQQVMSAGFDIQPTDGSGSCAPGYDVIDETVFSPTNYSIAPVDHEFLDLGLYNNTLVVNYDDLTSAAEDLAWIHFPWLIGVEGFDFNTYIVDTDQDVYDAADGLISLGEAIQLANNAPTGNARILFDLDAYPVVIDLVNELPIITGNIYIDGYSSTGSGFDVSGPVISIRNTNVYSSLNSAILDVEGSLIVSGLGFHVASTYENIAVRTYDLGFGEDTELSFSSAAVYNCVFTSGSGINSKAIVFEGRFNAAMGNVIGTNMAGDPGLSFSLAGIEINPPSIHNLIGGWEVGRGNWIVGGSFGVRNNNAGFQTGNTEGHGTAIHRNSIFNCTKAIGSYSTLGYNYRAVPPMIDINSLTVDHIEGFAADLQTGPASDGLNPCEHCYINLYKTNTIDQAPEYLGTTITDINGEWTFDWLQDHPTYNQGDQLVATVTVSRASLSYFSNGGPEYYTAATPNSDIYDWLAIFGTTSELSDPMTVPACSFEPFCFQWQELTVPAGEYLAIPSCEDLAIQAIELSLDQQNFDFQEEYLDQFEAQYEEECASPENLNDSFQVSYSLGYHHYTLFYYDRAGNLHRTIPPEGVVYTDVDNDLPEHGFITQYGYNSLAQLTHTSTPDGGDKDMFYDAIGQLRYSQDAQQLVDSKLSYSKYDELGRPIESGECDDEDGNPSAHVNNMAWAPNAKEVNRARYSESASIAYQGKAQRYLQNRVSSRVYDEDGDFSTIDDQTANKYSYDVHGNVEWLAQSVPGIGTRFMAYDYDLFSGNVTQFSYSDGEPDQFYHRYEYDADNRLTNVYTSTDEVIWDQDARYVYYKHGPLARLEIGEDKIQGIDYAYTLQGWIKAINHDDLLSSELDDQFADDLFGMVLTYYEGDFVKTNSEFNSLNAGLTPDADRNLYNGNIATWSSNFDYSVLPAGTDLQYQQKTAYKYRYDQLNRIKSGDFQYYVGDPGLGSWNATQDYAVDYSYDANGNIMSLNRNGHGEAGIGMDELSYYYNQGVPMADRKNQLIQVADAISSSGYQTDFEGISSYTYDETGNLISDTEQSIDEIEWNASGKIKRITRTTSGHELSDLEFIYDVDGNRAVKIVKPREYTGLASNNQLVDQDQWIYTYYVRDGSGNITANYTKSTFTYEGGYQETYRLTEQPIYGASRIGVHKRLQEPVVRTIDYIDGFGPMIIEPNTTRVTENSAQWTGYNQTTTMSNATTTITSNEAYLLGYSDDSGAPVQAPGLATVMAQGAVLGENVLLTEDQDGVPVFYSVSFANLNGSSDATLVYNRFGFIMQNLTDEPIIASSNGSMQAAQLGNSSRFALFTVGEDDVVYRHIIDLEEPGFTLFGMNMGAIVETNVPVSSLNHAYKHDLAIIEDHRAGGLIHVYATRTSEDNPFVQEVVVIQMNQGDLTFEEIVLDSYTAGAGSSSTDRNPIRISPNGNLLSFKYDHSLFQDALRTYQLSETMSGAAIISNNVLDMLTIVEDLDFSSSSQSLYVSMSKFGASSNDTYLTGETGTAGLYRTNVLSGSQDPIAAGVGDVRRTINGEMMMVKGAADDIVLVGDADDPSPQPVVSSVLSDDMISVSGWAIAVERDYTSGLSKQVSKIFDNEQQQANFGRALGERSYEIVDHLANSRALFSDKKLIEMVGGEPDVNQSKGDLQAIANHYPFGMQMPSRGFSGDDFRYGFQGQEEDEEFLGGAASYKYRVYDSRIGRFLSLDPLAPNYPHNSPYTFSENVVINSIELEGLEKVYVYNVWYDGEGNKHKKLSHEEINVKASVDQRVYRYYDAQGELYAERTQTIGEGGRGSYIEFSENGFKASAGDVLVASDSGMSHARFEGPSAEAYATSDGYGVHARAEVSVASADFQISTSDGSASLRGDGDFLFAEAHVDLQGTEENPFIGLDVDAGARAGILRGSVGTDMPLLEGLGIRVDFGGSVVSAGGSVNLHAGYSTENDRLEAGFGGALSLLFGLEGRISLYYDPTESSTEDP